MPKMSDVKNSEITPPPDWSDGQRAGSSYNPKTVKILALKGVKQLPAIDEILQ